MKLKRKINYSVPFDKNAEDIQICYVFTIKTNHIPFSAQQSKQHKQPKSSRKKSSYGREETSIVCY